MKKVLIILLFVSVKMCFGQVSSSGCYLSGGMSNEKTAGCGSGTTACNMAATSFSSFGAFCGSAVTGNSGGQVSVSSNLILPAGCQATVEAEMKKRTTPSAAGCTNSGPDAGDYISISNSGGTIAGQGGTICCSGAACTAYPPLPGSVATVTSAAGFTTGCSNADMYVKMIVTGGTITILGRSDRGDEITTYTVNLDEATCGPACNAVLPIGLEDFSGVENEGSIRLTWRVSSEYNVLNYIIERSVDGLRFFPIDTVRSISKSAGNYNLSYAATDHTPETGINYYRLVNVDNDGTTSTSKIISVLYSYRSQSFLSFSIDEQFVNVIIKNSQMAGSLVIYDLTGRIVKQIGRLPQEMILTFPKTELANGLYLVGLSDSDIPLKKLIIQ